jgi:protein-tyrosine phosphatase
MIDIHSHILPGMDDGSRSVDESISLLEQLKQQGVQLVAATPHFYASEERPAQFLKRRQAAASQLEQAMTAKQLPTVILGAEVHYFDGMSRAEELGLLKLEQTDLLLLEMPFTAWSGRMIAEIKELQSRRDTTVVLAHIERYLALEKPQTWERLLTEGVQMQCNAEFFLNWKTKRRALRMLKDGRIQFLGSDCHNMTARPPRIGSAMEVIDQALGERGREILIQKAALQMMRTEGR